MDFLYKLYENEYFAIGLFGVIGVLLALFIIVLILAIRDSKRNKVSDLNKQEQIDKKVIEDEIAQEEIEKQKIITDADFAFDAEGEIEKVELKEDITLENPETENSMNELLNKFEEPKLDVQDNDIDDLDDLIAKVSTDEVNSPVDLIGKKVIEEEEIDDDDFELPAIKKAADIDEIVEDSNLLDIDDEELPEVKVDEIKSQEIDLEKTGVLNFSNIETESYDIKKNK